MKITADAKALLDACLTAAAVAPAKPHTPALGRVLLSAAGDSLTVSATDLEIGVRQAAAGVSVRRPGACLVPPAKLVALLRESAGEVTLAAEDEAAALRTSGGQFKLPASDPAEFPAVEPFPAGPCTTIPAGELRRLIARVSWAADRHDSTARFATRGVMLSPDRGRLRVCGTDTRKLAIAEADAAETPADKREYLLPIKGVQILERLLPKDDAAAVRLSFTGSVAAAAVASAVVRMRLLEGRFPPYQQIMPKKPAVAISLPAGAFASAVRQAAVLVRDDALRVSFAFARGELVLTADGGADHGRGEVTLPLPDYSGPAVEIALNPQYLIEMLRAVGNEPTITLELTDGQKPAVFRLGEAFSCLVMPLSD